MHILESESERIQDEFSLSDAENISAFENFADLEHRLPHLRFDLFDEMRRLLMGDDAEAACVWSACDPYATPAVHGIEGHGELSNCGRTDKDGVEFLKAESVGYERYIVLYRTPEGEGGCAGCRFFLMCKGQCPGTAIDGDWRNRSPALLRLASALCPLRGRTRPGGPQTPFDRSLAPADRRGALGELGG